MIAKTPINDGDPLTAAVTDLSDLASHFDNVELSLLTAFAAKNGFYRLKDNRPTSPACLTLDMRDGHAGARLIIELGRPDGTPNIIFLAFYKNVGLPLDNPTFSCAQLTPVEIDRLQALFDAITPAIAELTNVTWKLFQQARDKYDLGFLWPNMLYPCPSFLIYACGRPDAKLVDLLDEPLPQPVVSLAPDRIDDLAERALHGEERPFVLSATSLTTWAHLATAASYYGKYLQARFDVTPETCDIVDDAVIVSWAA